jgi:hypothetical protein
MKSALIGIALFSFSAVAAVAEDSIEECMVSAKVLQNPSALAGAAEVCMQNYFDVLSAEANECREQAATKKLSGPELAACQATLILGLRDQIETCREQAEDLSGEDNALASQVGAGAINGCEQLVEQSKKICRDNATKFSSGLGQSTAEGACKAAGL